MPIISIRDLVVEYDGHRVLDGLSLDIEHGETMVLLGGSGSGKSTLLQMVAGILPPSAGTVSVTGRVSALLELGSGRLIPGFEEQLVGVSAGEERVVEVTFPAEYAEHLAGKAATFEVTVKEVKRKRLPELDDEFASDSAGYDTLEELREEIAGRLRSADERAIEREFEAAVIDAAVAEAQIEVPERLVHARAHELLERMLATYPDERELTEQISECEHEGDAIVHSAIQRLNQTFVTPIEREDILELTSTLDDVVDYTEEVADYLGLYRIEAPMDQAIWLARVLKDASGQIAEAIPNLRGFRDISRYTVEVNRLENEGDRITREAVASLFDGGIDPMVVIRWKDIFERLEAAIDAAERAANIIEGIVIKNS